MSYVHFYHSFYGMCMTLFWVFVCAIGVFYRALAHYEARQSRRFGPSSWIRRWFKRNILVPATFGKHCTQDIGGWATVPSRIQSITLLLFLVLNIGCTVHGYIIFPGNI